jgi:N-acetylmuramoyl-L-alanine amidase
VNFWTIEPVDLVARIMRAEARGEGVNGLLMVGSVIRNRVHDGRFGTGWHGVCLKPYQFSCFSKGAWNENNLRVLHEEPSDYYRDLAVHAMYGDYPSHEGATHYCNPNGMSKPMLKKWLMWCADKKMIGCGVVGKHLLFREV